VRVVFDTVVLVRGLIDPFSWSGKLLFEWHGAYEWVALPVIVTEYLDVVHRPRIGSRFRPRENRELSTVLSLLSAATIVFPTDTPAVCRDPSDDKFLAAAETGSADFIVSEDNDLLSLAEYKGTRICTAEAVLRELGRDLR
jgi:uncharacterized protein